jgi:hypothetical protein
MVPRQALRRGGTPQHVADLLERFRDVARRHRIRCPTCAWTPDASSRWACADTAAPEHFSNGCGTAWNTFDTRGRCPGCRYQWQWTVCLSCHMWAKHGEWYASEDER